MNMLGLFPVMALGVGLALNAMTSGVPDAQAEVQQVAQLADDEVPPDIIAVQIRKQGYTCTTWPTKSRRCELAADGEMKKGGACPAFRLFAA